MKHLGGPVVSCLHYWSRGSGFESRWVSGASDWYWLTVGQGLLSILVVGKGRGGMFLFLPFLHFHSCSSFFPFLSFISSAISSISLLPLSGRRHKMTHKGWRVVKPQHSQSIESRWRQNSTHHCMALHCPEPFKVTFWSSWFDLKMLKGMQNTKPLSIWTDRHN